MIRKTLALTALLLGMTAMVGVHPASAGGGPSDYANCLVTVEPSVFEAGDTVTVRGTGLQPNFQTTVRFDTTVQLGAVTTDATGAFELQVSIPLDAVAGTHTISCSCDDQGNVSSTDVIVSSSAATTTTTPSGGPLPRTGSDSEPLLVVGGIAILVGIGFVLVAKRRRRGVAEH